MNNRHCQSFLFFISGEFNVISQYHFGLNHLPVTEINFLIYVCGHLKLSFLRFFLFISFAHFSMKMLPILRIIFIGLNL